MSYALEVYVEELGHVGWAYAGAMTPYAGDAGPGTPATRPEPYYWTGEYDVMAILAGFRNPQPGWVGPFVPVVLPRGLSADRSPELAAWTAYTPPEEDRYPAGWLTLAEVLAFDWAGHRNRHRNRFGMGTGADEAANGDDVGYAEVAHEFLARVVHPLARRDVDPARIRFVFWIG
jgi:hypothetical protein